MTAELFPLSSRIWWLVFIVIQMRLKKFNMKFSDDITTSTDYPNELDLSQNSTTLGLVNIWATNIFNRIVWFAIFTCRFFQPFSSAGMF